MQSRLRNKIKVFVFFSFGVSLKTWFEKNILEREVKYYKHLGKKNIEISFVTYGDKTDLSFKKKLKNIQVIPLFNKIPKNIFSKYFILLFAPFLLKSKISKCNLIKTHQVSGGLLAVICAKFFKKNLVVRAGWEPTNEYKKWDISFFKYVILIINSFLSYHASKRIITTSTELKKFISCFYFINKNKIEIIPNNVQTKLFKKIKTTKYRNKIFSISRLEKQKNLSKLLNICEKSQIDIDIIGKGSEYRYLKNYSKNLSIKVGFLGAMKNEKLPEIISKYLFYITTSKIEGSPKSIIESMSCEIPIVGLKAKGINSLIKNNFNGYIYNNEISLVNKIRLIKNKKKLLTRLGKNCRTMVERNYSQTKCVEKEINLIEDLLL